VKVHDMVIAMVFLTYFRLEANAIGRRLLLRRACALRPDRAGAANRAGHQRSREEASQTSDECVHSQLDSNSRTGASLASCQRLVTSYPKAAP
jgi:hypothetical protein